MQASKITSGGTPWRYLAVLAVANLALLLADGSALRVGAALLLTGLLPGLSWARRLLGGPNFLLRWVAACGLSTVITSLSGMLLHYLPGPVAEWQLLVALNGVALFPLLFPKADFSIETKEEAEETGGSRWQRVRLLPIPLVLIFLAALLLRGANLNYSEFQGDEALAMITAAEALEGHEDALFLRSKGPGEVLLPMAMWRLSGTINEATARLPFSSAALLAVVTIYLIGEKIGGGTKVGWLAAGFLAANGFMVGFGRIVQYQALVIWMSALAVLMLQTWRQSGQRHVAALGGLFLGTGLLAHYDAVLVLPAAGWLLMTRGAGRGPVGIKRGIWGQTVQSWLAFGLALLLMTLPFYLPFGLDPQANRTGAYVGERIGQELRNNLPDFFQFTSFYSSFYYLIVSGGLVLGWLGWTMWRAGPGYRWASVLGLAGVAAVILRAEPPGGLSFLPFALLFLGAFLACPEDRGRTGGRVSGQAMILWLAVPFLGYNFVVALGLTHIYTTVPAWSVLTALGWKQVSEQFGKKAGRSASREEERARVGEAEQRGAGAGLSAGLAAGLLLLLSTLFLWNAFIRQEVEYWQDYPEGNLALFWTPYRELPQAGFFGFAHRSGWKASGQAMVSGALAGDYGSNEEPDVTVWYTRGAPRACDPQPEFYLLASDLVDPIEAPTEMIEASYAQIGQVRLPNQKGMRILQQRPEGKRLGELDERALADEFDRTARPGAFARSARGSAPMAVNFGNQIGLIGYDLDSRRAYPGGRVPVTLYWQALGEVPASYQVFAHLEGEGGPVAQADGAPVCWRYPTDRWRPGQIIADQHAIFIPLETAPGVYPLEVGLYLPDTLERVEVLDVAGNAAGVSVRLEEVEVRGGNRK